MFLIDCMEGNDSETLSCPVVEHPEYFKDIPLAQLICLFASVNFNPHVLMFE